jgi:predicted AAA+ superfamily ATPase
MIQRLLETKISDWLGYGKALVVTGPRQCGKTTLLSHLTHKLNKSTLWWTGDDPEMCSMMDQVSISRLTNIIGKNEVVVIDEAQRFSDTGIM